jgi:hypothetical protein
MRFHIENGELPAYDITRDGDIPFEEESEIDVSTPLSESIEQSVIKDLFENEIMNLSLEKHLITDVLYTSTPCGFYELSELKRASIFANPFDVELIENEICNLNFKVNHPCVTISVHNSHALDIRNYLYKEGYAFYLNIKLEEDKKLVFSSLNCGEMYNEESFEKDYTNNLKNALKEAINLSNKLREDEEEKETINKMFQSIL